MKSLLLNQKKTRLKSFQFIIENSLYAKSFFGKECLCQSPNYLYQRAFDVAANFVCFKKQIVYRPLSFLPFDTKWCYQVNKNLTFIYWRVWIIDRKKCRKDTCCRKNLLNADVIKIKVFFVFSNSLFVFHSFRFWSCFYYHVALVHTWRSFDGMTTKWRERPDQKRRLYSLGNLSKFFKIHIEFEYTYKAIFNVSVVQI